MTSSVSTILHRANKKNKYNILTFDTHERFETNLSRTGHNFYSYRVNNGDAPYQIKKWNTVYGEVPHNRQLMDEDLKEKQMYDWIDFDVILSQNKFGQYQIAKQISKQLHIPIISLEHTLPMPRWGKNTLQQTFEMQGHINVFISEYSRNKWGFDESNSEVIHHGIDTELFKNLDLERENKPISVVNDLINRDEPCGYRLWREVTNNIKHSIWGDTPGLSKPTNGVEHLVKLYNQHTIFLNTSRISPIPTALLEAMACGCVPISTNNCMIPEIIKHGENGLLSNDAEELQNLILEVQNNEKLRTKLSYNARKTIVENFCLSDFTKNWNKIFDNCSKIAYIG